MEFILVIAVIVVLCVILGVSTDTMIMLAAIFVWLILAVMNLLFIYCFARLLFSKRVNAKFVKIDKSPKSSFRVAYYTVEDKEYPNVFPEEGFFRSKLYKKDKNYKVMLNRRKTFVFDRFACATCIMGLIFSTFLTVGSILLFVS